MNWMFNWMFNRERDIYEKCIVSQRQEIEWLRGMVTRLSENGPSDPGKVEEVQASQPLFPPVVQKAIDLISGTDPRLREDLESYAIEQLQFRPGQFETIAAEITAGMDLSEL